MTTIESLAKLRDSGFEQRQAEAIIDVFERSKADYVTKADLEAAVARLESRIAQVEAKISEAKNAVWLPFFLLLASQIAGHFWK